MRILDLSAPVDATGFEPEPVVHDVLSAADGARHLSDRLREHLGVELDPAELPGGEFLTLDTLTLTTHTGTHVDAPAHYGSTAAYGRPRTIDELPLDWFLAPGLLLDLTAADGDTITAPDLERAMKAAGHRPDPGDIVLLDTGAARWAGQRRYFTDFRGLGGDGVELLLDLGVRVIGTDAFSLDAPFAAMIARYRETGDPAALWPAHFAGRRREFCQLERLANLSALPAPTGFTVACFPVKIARAGAAWARAVALISEPGGAAAATPP